MAKDVNYKIYMHKNKINGKVYIGQTGQSLVRRWNNGNGYVNNVYFYRAIQKYGWENFEHVLLKDGLTKEEADIFETKYISEYNSNNPKHGYNISSGGAGSPVIKYTDIYKYDLNGNYICKYNDITELPKSWQPAIRSCCDEKIYTSYGFQWKLYYREKIEPAKTRRETHVSKEVFQYEMNGCFIRKYNSITEAAECNEIKRDGISKCCNGGQKSYSGYQWSFVYQNKLPSIDISMIYQFDLLGNFIQKYDTIAEASEITDIYGATISNCINGRIETAGGFVWKRLPSDFNTSEAIHIKTKRRIGVVLIDDNGNDIKKYPSLASAANELNIKNIKDIKRVCNGEIKKVKGYKFRYL